MPLDEQLELIDAHPRLGAPPADVSALSCVEQGTTATPRNGKPRRRRDGRRGARPANAAYEARLGFRYCVFVAGRSRAALLPEMTAALDADRDDEIERALDAVIDIARDRYATLTATAAEDPADRTRREPLRQGGHPAGPRRARPERPPRPRPDRGDRPRGRFRRRAHGRRQRERHRHRHDEEHRLRVRQGSSRRLDRGLRPCARRAFPRRAHRSMSRPSTSAPTTGAPSMSRARRRPMRSSAAARGRGSRRSARRAAACSVEAGVEDLSS